MDYHLKLDQSRPIAIEFSQRNWWDELKLAVGNWVSGVLLGLAILAALLILLPCYARANSD
ncbi:MAG TPA: hypothetical protein VEG25_03395 [Burkholderiales bacterium]|nr:hypothetical protein [Burkholderiales bacterium]